MQILHFKSIKIRKYQHSEISFSPAARISKKKQSDHDNANTSGSAYTGRKRVYLSVSCAHSKYTSKNSKLPRAHTGEYIYYVWKKAACICKRSLYTRELYGNFEYNSAVRVRCRRPSRVHNVNIQLFSPVFRLSIPYTHAHTNTYQQKISHTYATLHALNTPGRMRRSTGFLRRLVRLYT